MRKIFFVFIISLCFNVNSLANTLDGVKAQSAVLIDMDTGRVLWGKNENKEAQMASTTKIMTAIIAIEMCDENEKVVISKRAAMAPEVDIDLNSGEEYYIKDLLLGLMLVSANDAAIAIAEHIGGSVEGFATIMNERAVCLGALNTEFVTPNGLDEGNHHSTAYDMGVIASYALNNEAFVRLINTKNATFTTTDGKRTISVYNKNRLLSEYEGAFGVKTGFTCKAGHCFVGAAKRGDIRLVSVVLGSGWGSSGKEYKWKDTKKILNYGFDNFSKYNLLKENTKMGNVLVNNSKTKSIPIITKNPIWVIATNDEKNNIITQKTVLENINAPVRVGQRVGVIRFFLNDEFLGESDIITVSSANKKTVLESARFLINNWF